MKKQLPSLSFKDSKLCITLVASGIVLVFLLGSFSGISVRGVSEKDFVESIEIPFTPDTKIITPDSTLNNNPGPADDHIETITPMHVLRYLFLRSSTLPPRGGDYNGDNKIDIADVVFLTKNLVHVDSTSSDV